MIYANKLRLSKDYLPLIGTCCGCDASSGTDPEMIIIVGGNKHSNTMSTICLCQECAKELYGQLADCIDSEEE